jgi:hypothetical protein
MDAPLYTTAFAIAINKATYEVMSKAQKQVIDEHCTGDWVAKIAGPFDEFERAGDAKLRTQPSGIYALTSNELALWKKAAEPLQNGWVETVRKVSAFASFRSRVSKPSVNHPYNGASSSRACCTLP